MVNLVANIDDNNNENEDDNDGLVGINSPDVNEDDKIVFFGKYWQSVVDDFPSSSNLNEWHMIQQPSKCERTDGRTKEQ